MYINTKNTFFKSGSIFIHIPKNHPAAAGAASSPTNQRNRSKHCSSITLEEQKFGPEDDDDDKDGNLIEKSPKYTK